MMHPDEMMLLRMTAAFAFIHPEEKEAAEDVADRAWSALSSRAKGGRAKSAAKTAAAKENIKKRWSKNNPIDETQGLGLL